MHLVLRISKYKLPHTFFCHEVAGSIQSFCHPVFYKWWYYCFHFARQVNQEHQYTEAEESQLDRELEELRQRIKDVSFEFNISLWRYLIIVHLRIMRIRISPKWRYDYYPKWTYSMDVHHAINSLFFHEHELCIIFIEVIVWPIDVCYMGCIFVSF